MSNLELELINSNFAEEEIIHSISYLKNNKNPGIDAIPAEIIKHCKHDIASHVTMPLII